MWGHYLGQYECAGEHLGAPYYRQTGDGDNYPGYLYRDAQTAWRAGWELGSTEDDDSSPLSITLQSEGELAAEFLTTLAPSPRRTNGAMGDPGSGTRRGCCSTATWMAGGELGTLLMTRVISGVVGQQGCGHHRLESGGTRRVTSSN